MSTERELSGRVRSWLREDGHEDADRIMDAVLDQLDTTPQRRAGWLARRFPIMNSTFARIGVAVAAVVVVAFVGYQLLPRTSVGDPSASPTLTPTPADTAAASPSSVPTTAAFPPRGELTIGRHSMTLAGVLLSMDFPSAGWTSNGEWGLDKGDFRAPSADSASFMLWPARAADNVFSDPCARTELDPPAGPSAADRAAAVAGIPGLELVSGPTAVNVGGQPAQHVVVRVPDTIGCAPNSFWLWYDTDDPTGENARYAGDLGETIYVWIIEVNGTIVWIDGSTWVGSGPEAAQEVQQIVDSLQFE